MALQTKTFDQFVADEVARYSEVLSIVTALPPGDPALAIFEAFATQLVFLQTLAIVVNALTRAQTSTGDDLDSFFAPFGFVRLPSTFADGDATFSTAVPASSQILLQVGTVIQTPGGALQYAVVAAAGNPNYSPTLNAYVLAIGQSSLVVPVQSLTAGVDGNTGANTLVQFSSPVPGFTSVTNAAPITNGAAAESDTAFRARFVPFLATLAKATRAAILAAILSVQQGLDVELLENEQIDGDPQLGEFVAVIDDGSGDPPSNLLIACQTAIDNTRAFSVEGHAIAPIKVVPSIALTIVVAAGADSPTVVAAVKTAIVLAVNATPVHGTVFINGTINETALGVANVASVAPNTTTIDGVALDLTANDRSVIRIAAANVAVST